MAKLIEFYVPTSYRKAPAKWIPAEEGGKLILFRLPPEEVTLRTGSGILATVLKRVRVSE